MNPKIMLNDYYDITEYVLSFPLIKEEMTFNGKLIDYKVEIEVDNQNQSFNLAESSSPLYKKPPKDFFITFRTDEHIIYQGTLFDVNVSEYKKAKLITLAKSYSFEKMIDKGYSKDTLYNVVMKLSKDYDFEVHVPSLRVTCEKLNNLELSLNYDVEKKSRIFDLFQDLGKKLGIWIWIKHDAVYFSTMRYEATGYKCLIKDSDLLTYNVLGNDSNRKIYNDYRIKYDVTKEVTDKTGDNIGEASRKKYETQKLDDIDLSTNGNIVVWKKEDAVVVGNNYINRFCEHFEIAEIELPVDAGIYIDLGDVIKLDYNGKSYVVYEKEYDYFTSKVKLVIWEVW